MFDNLIQKPITSEQLTWNSRQVLRDLDGAPHLFARVELKGTHFPERALEPFVRVGKLRSRFVRLAHDGQSVRAYFDRPPTDGGTVEFGYGDEVLLRWGPKRWPPGTKLVERFFEGPR